MTAPNYKLTKYACFFTYPALTPLFILPPILFLTFRQMYGVSYSLLGTLVLTNFCVQLGVDLFFSFFSLPCSHKNILRATPLMTVVGMLVYALVPTFFPEFAYGGLLIGTVIFSISSGLNEVFLSPTLASLPTDNLERDMSTMHSLYGYASVVIAVASTLFLQFFGRENWIWLVLFWAIFPLICFVLFCFAPLPDIAASTPTSQSSAKRRTKGLLLCLACIFLGSAAENTMTNWVSVYMERTLQIPKAVGDTLGLASFALLLAITRSAYAKYGKSIYPVLLAGMTGAVICYLAAGLSTSGIVAIIACMIAGVCTAMLWPGTLLFMEEQFPNPGVAAYALMAAGGDFGASVAPQGLGIVADTVAAGSWAAGVGEKIGLSAEQVGIKVGMLCTALFPFIGIFVLLYMKKFFNLSQKK